MNMIQVQVSKLFPEVIQGVKYVFNVIQNAVIKTSSLWNILYFANLYKYSSIYKYFFENI